MSKTLVIVESPAKAKTISKYLGSDYVVKSSVGHIRDLPKGKSKKPPQRNTIPKDLPEDEKRLLRAANKRNALIRKMGVDPDKNWEIVWQVSEEKTKVVKELKSLMWLGRVFISLLRSLFVFVIDGFIFVGFDCLAMSSFWIFLFRPRHF